MADTTNTSTIIATEKSTHRVEVFNMPPLAKHPNADSLSVVKIADTEYTYVARTEDWQNRIGCLVAWVPPDSIVKLDRPEFVFLKATQKDGRIKAKRLRGITSYGLLIPLGPEHNLKPGDDAAIVLEVEHYDPEVHSKAPGGLSMGGDVASPPKGTYPKYDVDSGLKYAKKVFKDNEPVYVSEKLHGASARYMFRDGQMYCGSRTEWKREFSAPPKITLEELIAKTGSEEKAKAIYEKAVNGHKPKRNMWWVALDGNPALKKFCEDHPGWCVYGECFGAVQNMNYGAKKGEVWFRAFDILVPSEVGQKWLDAKDFIEVCDKAGLARVPEIGIMPWNFDKVIAHQEGNSTFPGANHIREGVVVKPIKERWDENLGRVMVKFVNPAYLEKN